MPANFLWDKNKNMELSQNQINAYHKDGYLLLPNIFSQKEIESMNSELPEVYGEKSPYRVVEKSSGTIRSVYGSHTTNKVFRNLTRMRQILNPVEQILKSQVYVYQFKINAKKAFEGDVWKWHQDYIFWLKEDGLLAPEVVTIVIFLDEVTEFNGPILLIPSSHQRGLLDVPPTIDKADDYKNDPDWINNLTSDIKYTIDQNSLQTLVKEFGIVAAKGASGSMLMFHPNTVHGSVANISPFDRNMVLISYCDVNNVKTLNNRPNFISSQDNTALLPVADDSLLATSNCSWNR